MVTAAEVLELLERDFELAPRGHVGHAPAEEFDVIDGPDRASWAVQPGRLGVIASVTRPFCRDCDRLRLTADGQLRTCLFAQDETDLRGPLRAGASAEELAAIIRTAVTASRPATASTPPISSSRSGPCPPSAVEGTRPSTVSLASRSCDPTRSRRCVEAVRAQRIRQQTPAGQEVGEMVGVLVARQPVLDARGVVQLGVAPLQIDGCGGTATAGRTPKIFFTGHQGNV